MKYNPDIHHRRYIPLPGHAKKPLIIQTMKISDIRDAVFGSGAHTDLQFMAGRVFDSRMFDILFLSDEEMIQVNRFKALKKQVEWVCGRFALKTLARDVLDLDLPLEKIRIAYREKGAPYLVRFPQVSISLSHSSNYTAAAISLDTGIGVGIDVEKIGDIPDAGFMKIAFTRDEISHMPANASAIFANWTLKEAFLKYLGLGFNESLHKVAVINRDIFYRGEKQAVTTRVDFMENQYAMGLVYGSK
ncbi:MAG: 4'-phosphopantetheinyl transferase superfamily protein [Desulfotignum sp.]